MKDCMSRSETEDLLQCPFIDVLHAIFYLSYNHDSTVVHQGKAKFHESDANGKSR